jgi:erythromycin esterase
MRCFEPYAESPQSYALAARLVPLSCEDEVIGLPRRLRDPRSAAGAGALDARFVAEQNAEAAAGAERYYRAMIGGGPESWNVRDCHMADTLDRLLPATARRSCRRSAVNGPGAASGAAGGCMRHCTPTEVKR